MAAAGGVLMARSILSVSAAITAAAVLAGSATAQPPRTSTLPGPATGKSGSRPGPGVPVLLPPPGEDLVPDFRLWLQGLNKTQLPKDVDPKLLKDLIDKLPKDEK